MENLPIKAPPANGRPAHTTTGCILGRSASEGGTRREFLKLAGAAAAAVLAPRLRAALPPRSPGAFEVSANLYAWDLHDEGVERVLDNLQGMAAVNAVYLVGVMHPERRPVGGGDFPHNPLRKAWQAEDARCYWHPDPRRYGRVRPRLSDYDWLAKTDWLALLVEAARKRGMKAGVEFSHSLIDRERMEGEFADLAQRNLHGGITREGAIKWLRPPCPNHPATRELIEGMVTDAVAGHGVDFLQSCIMSFDPAPPEKGGGCFCDHCRSAAQEMGIDLGKVQAALLVDPKPEPALSDWRLFREETVGRFYALMRGAAHAVNPGVDLRYNLHSRWNYAAYGINPARLWPRLDSMRLTDYAEQDGLEAGMRAKRQWLAEMRQKMAPGFPVYAPVAMRIKATPELIREGVRIVVDSGMVGMTASHYDGATFPLLRAVRDGLFECGVKTSFSNL